MIKLEGNLGIRTIHGRYGPFNVGNLATPIGDFVVKDAVLDQYNEGQYTGVFGITRIAPAYYSQGTRLVVELRVTLETMALEGIEALDEAAVAPVEPDPIDEPALSAPSKASDEATPELSDAPETDEALFGDLWPLGEVVKLDPTVGRRDFRQQRDRLKACGYRFEPVGQTWHLTTAA